MSKIVILRGNAGSGKSTVAKSLHRKLGRGTLLISQDCIRDMLLVSDEPENQAIELIENIIIYGSQKCDFIILEGILYEEIYRRLFRRIEELFSSQIFAYYFDLPFEETLKRHKQRRRITPSLHVFGEIEMSKWWRHKDRLNNICEKTLNKDMSLDEIVELIYSDLQLDNTGRMG